MSWIPIATSKMSLFAMVVTFIFGYLAVQTLYRLFFHPLSKFPGPKLAAVTYAVEFYHDVLCPGQYTWVIRTLHKKYGPIIRISPSELHIDDPDFYNELYTGSSNPRDKWARTADLFGNPTAHFGTVSDDLHKARRAPFNNHFSKKSVISLSPLITAQVEKLCQRLDDARGKQTPVNLKYAYAALALDVVSEYAFGKPYAALDDSDFAPRFLDMLDGLISLCHLNVFFPWIAPIMLGLPHWMVRILNPQMMSLVLHQDDLNVQIETIMKDPLGVKAGLKGSTIFHEMIGNDEMPIQDRNLRHYMHEAQSVIGAGQVTTAHHLSTCTFHLLSNPNILHRLQRELEAAMPDPTTLPPLVKLEELEYLTAVICEGHRLACGTVHRLQRVSPKLPIIYQQWIIPPGTAVGMTTLLMHDNPDIFPSPSTYDPDRFLGKEGQKRKKYLVPFSKGTRSCLGQNLGNAELFFTLAAIFRRFDLTLFETTRDDVQVAYDYFVPQMKKGTVGLRVTVE